MMIRNLNNFIYQGAQYITHYVKTTLQELRQRNSYIKWNGLHSDVGCISSQLSSKFATHSAERNRTQSEVMIMIARDKNAHTYTNDCDYRW